MALGAGRGQRLDPLTRFTPKPLLPIGNVALIDHIAQQLADAGFNEFGLNAHHLAHVIEEHVATTPLPARPIVRREAELRGPAGSLLTFEDYLVGAEVILVVSGDGLTDLNLADFVDAHRRSGRDLSVAMKRVKDAGRYGVARIDERDLIIGFEEKPSIDDEEEHPISCGVYALSPALMQRFPRNRPYDFGADLIPELVANGQPVRAHLFEDYWNDIGIPSVLASANLDAVEQRVDLRLINTFDPSDPGHLVGKEIHPTAQITGRVVVGDGVRIGRGAVVRGPAVLGQGAHVGSDAHIASSVLLPGAVVPDGGLAVAGLLAACGAAGNQPKGAACGS